MKLVFDVILGLLILLLLIAFLAPILAIYYLDTHAICVKEHL